ncbi:unnamed protein product [Amoebophrya sp. A25]|nr:unnamed protein product [Amoebophrya sp. A25]|eukprot:GSA25T00014998001.1
MPVLRAGILQQAKLDGTRINLWMSAGYCGVVTYCAYRILERRNERELDRLDQLAMARVQLESPQFKCYFAALQYRDWRCFDLQLYKTLHPELPEGIRYENDSRIHKLWREALERRKNKRKGNSDIDTQLDCSDEGLSEDLMNVNYKAEAKLTNKMLEAWELAGDLYDVTKDWLRRWWESGLLTWPPPPEDDEDLDAFIATLPPEEQKQAHAEKRHLSVQKERQEVLHCRNLDTIINRCAGELYSMIPPDTPCLRPLPSHFQPTKDVVKNVVGGTVQSDTELRSSSHAPYLASGRFR